MRRAKVRLSAMIPGTMASAVSASRQFTTTRIPTAMPRRSRDSSGDTTAICSSPVVVSTSPVSRERMPPVFMSHRRGSGRWRRRSNSERRSDSMTRVFRRRWR